MAGKVWTAHELASKSPAEQDAIFAQSVVHDLTLAPAEFVEGVR